MAARPFQRVLHYIRTLTPPLNEMGQDGQLLQRFALCHDEAAFQALMQRHGPMVFAVCRRVLRHEHDAEDAFQATFLVLARKATTIRKPESVGSWLYGVAYRIANKARERAARLPVCDAAALRRAAVEPRSEVGREMWTVLDEELARLPEKYRAPLVMCGLQGQSRLEAARQLGWKEGTVSSRLARARALLEARLARRGWTIPAAGLLSVLPESAAASPVLVTATLRLVALCAAGECTAGSSVPAEVLALANGTLRWMFLSQVKHGAVLALGTLVLGATLLAGQVLTVPAPPESQPAAVEAPREQPPQDVAPAGAVAQLGSSLLRHGGAVQTVAYSPNGSLIASAGRNIKIWDAKTGRLVHALRGHNHGCWSVTFSPDGKLLASGGADWTARIWDAETGQQLQLLRCHRFGLLGTVHPIQVAFAPDGRSVITGGLEGVIQVWDVAAGREQQRFRPQTGLTQSQQDAEAIFALAVSPDGRIVAAGSAADHILLWDLTTGKVSKEISVPKTFIRKLAFSPNGKVLAWRGSSGAPPTADAGIGVYELASGKKRLQISSAKTPIYGIAFAPDGRHLASAGLPKHVKLWDIITGQEMKVFVGHTDTPAAVAFAPDGRTLASAGDDGSIKLWDVATGRERFTHPEGTLDQVVALALGGDGRTVLTGSKDGTIRVWDAIARRVQRSFTVGGGTEFMAFSDDGTSAALARGMTVACWDVATMQRRWQSKEFLRVEPGYTFKNNRARSPVFSADGRRLAAATTDDFRNPNKTVLRIWDVTSGKLLTQLNRPTYIPAPPILSADGKLLTLNECVQEQRRLQDQALRRYDATTGALLHAVTSQQMFGNALACSPDGKTVAIGTSRSCVRIHDADTGELRYMVQGPRTGANLDLMAFAPDSNRLAAAATYADGPPVLHVWDLAAGRLTHEFFVSVNSLRFAPDSRRLVAGLVDGTTMLWDLASPAAPRPRRAPLTRQDLEERWTRQAFGLDSSTGNAGNYARADALVEGGDATVAFLEEKLLDPDLAKKDAAEAKRLVAPLADASREVREAAMHVLMQHGDRVYLSVQGLDEAPAPAQRLVGIETVLQQNFEYRRSSHGSIDVLRQIGTLRARRLLEKLSQGPQETLEQKNRALLAKYTLDDLKGLRMPEEK